MIKIILLHISKFYLILLCLLNLLEPGGMKVTKPEEVESSFKEALNMEGVVLLEVEVDSDEMVYPMIAPGAAMNEMIMDPVDIA